MQKSLASLTIAALLFLGLPTGGFAATSAKKTVKKTPKNPLETLYTSRSDLQNWFDASKNHIVKPGATTDTISLKDWAEQYGWRSEPTLAAYTPKSLIATPKPEAEAVPDISTKAFAILDRKTGLIIATKDAATPRPIASLTKLVTNDIVLSAGIPRTRTRAISQDDIVGGSSLGVKAGTKFTIDDLLFASFLVSANDATNALARATGFTRTKFVGRMNAKAEKLGLARTRFADPTGIDAGNVSTPREFAKLINPILARADVQRYATTAKRTITTLPRRKKIALKNSDGLLWKDEYDDLLVSAGKTGYLGPEVGWNLAVSLRDAKNKKHPELLIVLFGTDTLRESLANAKALARWTWDSHDWKKAESAKQLTTNR